MKKKRKFKARDWHPDFKELLDIFEKRFHDITLMQALGFGTASNSEDVNADGHMSHIRISDLAFLQRGPRASVQVRHRRRLLLEDHDQSPVCIFAP